MDTGKALIITPANAVSESTSSSCESLQMTESLQIRQRDNLRPMLIELKNFHVYEPSMTAPPPYPTPAATEVHEPGSKLRSRLWWLTIWIICVYPFSVNLVDPDLWVQ